ncbi:glutamate synthase-related protein [Paenactinomyces guangxiensis]|uniref:Glutamate synthase n=1 Tax=Paenactinomyces guangxiensis TaxID=1490290 RepID=A0A7W1WSZ5_9BACL|nr:glutamate synthase-related protein [Paenactinomyces guangxiensis]MBA4495433.1 glutamate synthase [Paenactinomyces guangxiensis]MBH8592446.1 glutamate synthase [Paenactinomyces guangxiensis]
MKRHSDLGRFKNLTAEEHDSCGIVATIEKDGVPKRENMLDTIEALIKMEHRSGFINGEGDGCGILTDIPRALWAQKISSQGISAELAYDPRFVVAHLFLPKHEEKTTILKDNIIKILKDNNFEFLYEELDQVNSDVLGKNGRADEPHFWQIACLASSAEGLPRRLFDIVIEVEKKFPVQMASFSNQTAVYKLMGAANLLPKYFYDLNHPQFETLVTIGHNRYSTNTLSNFFRVQPFSLLGHNGEINTIRKLRDEAEMIGVPLAEGSSDSQDLNRLIETLIHHYGYSLFEAIEIVFPPIVHEIKHLPSELKDLYTYYRQTWGPFAQGPAGIISRYGDECAFSVDALGLRPLWMVESERSLFFSSEQGIIPVHEMVSEPKPLAPGETVGVQLLPKARVLPHHELQQLVLERARLRADFREYQKYLSTPAGSGVPGVKTEKVSNQAYAAFGWEREQIQQVEQMADTGADPIRSLGHDGPLAALANTRQNISDFIKESVAVVTNPAIDREREMEHFSTRVLIGRRPDLYSPAGQNDLRLELPSPILVEGHLATDICTEFSTLSLEELVQLYVERGLVARLPLSYAKGTRMADAFEELEAKAIKAVKDGKVILLLDDSDCHQNDQYYLDPHLAISKVDQGLKNAPWSKQGQNLRRLASIVVRSGAMRNLHDLALAVGLGADAICPYLMFGTIVEKENKSAANLFNAINKGLEKIISTIGIHELRGYARLFSSIGLSPEVAGVLGIVNYCGSKTAGLSWADLEKDAEERYEDFANAKAKPARLFHLWPRVWKSIGQLASGSISYEEFKQKLDDLERANPISIRHVADLRHVEHADIEPSEVDLSVGDHDLPMVISSMSFGSQGEVAFRAYAEAADRLNMVSINGEGGEIKDMLGKYPRTRGHQVASGRFGVNVELANSANILEIKIGQGAKPGEGGHLPGKKVSAKVAAARNATPGSDLISPSNNHDIYSIEDLAQIITELKTANNRAKVIVKVPIVPNIGTIAVGIAKAGADIITLSGFDGGTGAARIHALQHVGLPAEIGVKAAHNALIEAGIRDQVEIWADGGLKSALDVIKLMLLGANRIGFGTLAMLAIGCTSCRGCHLDTCHVGIATQIETVEEAEEHGLRRFVPRVYEQSVEGLMRLFTTFGQEIQCLTASLGFKRTQDLVGRSDLLVQMRELDKLDLSDLLEVSSLNQGETTARDERELSSSPVLVAAGAEHLSTGEEFTFDQPVFRSYSGINSANRVMVSDVSGARVRNRLDGSYRTLPEVNFNFEDGSVPGNGFAAFHADGIRVTVRGGAQDGVGKTAFGGRVAILKSPNKNRQYINGSVGKGFCYGAQKGLFIVQGDADSRAGIRLSGADIIIAGQIKEPLRDELGLVANRANIKGFAFEYMTDGRAVVLGDPGPWICSGMTGGVVYLRLQPEMGLDEAALMRRIAKAAKVSIEPLNEKGVQDLNELLRAYQEELIQSGQLEESEQIDLLLQNLDQHFIQIIPHKQQADPSISTE